MQVSVSNNTNISGSMIRSDMTYNRIQVQRGLAQSEYCISNTHHAYDRLRALALHRHATAEQVNDKAGP